jgi:hypothetical protein
LIAGAVALPGYHARLPPRLAGDAWEYWYQAESFHRHGTPELWPEAMAAVNAWCRRRGVDEPPREPYAYFTAPDGRKYGAHFWAYALSAVPAKEYLRRTGGCELTALALTNAGWIVLALAVTLFGSSAPPAQRLALAALATVGPVVWYLTWPGAELFSWALALMAVVAYRDRRDGWAGAAAGLAATQNPPLIFLGGAAVLAAACGRRWRAAAAAAAGTALGLMPFAYFQYHFGKPSLIATELSVLDNLSWVRTWGVVGDFNQGLLPYVPLLVAGAAVGVARSAMVGNTRGLILAAAGVAVAVGTEVAGNWNSSGEGLQRYLVWVLPIAAGVAVEGIGGSRRLAAFAAVAALAHTAILVAYERTDLRYHGYLRHSPPAEWVLTHWPRAYWVDPEVFTERQRNRDGFPHDPPDLPVAHVRPDGTVSKLLLDAGSVEKVGERFMADPSYLAALRVRAAAEPGYFYAHPPAGAVRARP